MPTTIIVNCSSKTTGEIIYEDAQISIMKKEEDKGDKQADRRCLKCQHDKTLEEKEKKKNDKDGRQVAEYQENHNTYDKKIKENLITVNDLLYRY